MSGQAGGYSRNALPQVLFRLPIEIDALPELPLDAAAELDGPGDAELPLELPGVLQREATRRRRWRPPPFSSLKMRNTR
jgi:hypothetical protein